MLHVLRQALRAGTVMVSGVSALGPLSQGESQGLEWLALLSAEAVTESFSPKCLFKQV